MRRVISWMLVGVVVFATPTFAQNQTLEDLRREVALLTEQMAQLRNELQTSGNGGVPQEQVGTFLQRLNALETQLADAMNRIETAQFRINQITNDATTRVGDIEFRLTELEGGDPTALGDPVPLGGTEPADVSTDLQLATNEQQSFNLAREALDAQDYSRAAEGFSSFIATYPGGPLTSEAQYLRGHALAGLQDWGGAARSFLDSFSGAPSGPLAAESLLELSVSLGQLQQIEQACLTLNEINVRYPERVSDLGPRIAEQKQAMNCP